MRALSGGTKPERIGESILKSIGIHFQTQHPIGPFIVDAFIPSSKLVVQFDGDYWHGHPSKLNPSNRIQKSIMTRDKSNNAYMKKRGLNVLRLWEHDLLNRPDHCKILLEKAINSDLSHLVFHRPV
jgi:very-short-patch-repair endonuclease